MKELITRNIGLKIAMLLAAIPVWLILINIADPTSTKTITGVEVHILNDDVITDNDQLYTVTSGKTVSFEVTARKKDISNITSEDFYVYADMQYYYGQDSQAKACDIHYDIVNHKDIIKSVALKNDTTLMFKLINVLTKEYSVKVEYTGTPGDDITIGSTEVEPSTITIKGTEDQLASIAVAMVEIDASKIDADTESVSGRVRLYNSIGKEITDTSSLEISSTTVSVLPQVLRSKVLSIALGEVSGTPADGYGYTGMYCDTMSVKVIGLKAALAELSTITIPDSYFDISGATGDITVSVNLADLVGENVTIAEENETIDITLMIEELKTKTYKLPVSDIVIENQNDDYTYNFNNETLLVTLKGFEYDLNSITSDDIVASIDVAGLKLGTHVVPVTLELTDGFTLEEEPTIGIRIRETTQPTTTKETAQTTKTDADKTTVSTETADDSEEETSRETTVSSPEESLEGETAEDDSSTSDDSAENEPTAEEENTDNE